MTCILALENTEDLDSTEVAYPQYVQDYLYNYQLENGAISLGGLMAGETLTMRDLLHAIMLPSANEAAMIIADHIGGSQEGFVAMMNKRAKELGAANTNFANANGLFDENHVTTAEDLAKMAMHALTLEGFRDIVKETSYETGPTNMHDNLYWETTNEMGVPESSYYMPSVTGVKTGYLPEAGRCFVSTATRDGFTYLLVVMGCDYQDAEGNPLPANMAFQDTKTLYDWVFESFKVKTLVENGKIVAEIPLKLALDKDFVKLMTSERFTALMHHTVDSSSVTIVPQNMPESLDAPVRKGDKIGEAALILSGEEIGRVGLLAAESVEASQALIMWEKVRAIISTFWFKFAVVFTVLSIFAYIILMLLRTRRRRRTGSGYKPRRRI
jgi:D-alanyl-D-alanine carboxypeptidase